MTTLDWSQSPAAESIPGKVSGAWGFKDTRMPVATVFENLEAGLSLEEVMEEFYVTREQINAVLHFAAKSWQLPSRPRYMQRPPMLVLFDHGTPRSIARWLHGHTVVEAIARGWIDWPTARC
jgi:uncharacterized protein (DUF433 family)